MHRLAFEELIAVYLSARVPGWFIKFEADPSPKLLLNCTVVLNCGDLPLVLEGDEHNSIAHCEWIRRHLYTLSLYRLVN